MAISEALIGAGAGIVGQVMGIANQRGQERRQVNQQRKLNELQINAQGRMNKTQKDLDLEMWRDTNYSAQVEEAKKAGMSISALYGGSGASGATVGGGGGGNVAGGVAEAPSQANNSKTALMMQVAQLGLLGAQKKNIEADTENKLAGAEGQGVTAEGGRIDNRGKAVEADAKEQIGADKIAQKYGWIADQEGIKAERANAEWEIEKNLGYKTEGGNISFESPDTPIAKAVKAKWEQAVTEANTAKVENNIKRANQAVEEFKAGLAKEGIDPNSPWYVKIIGDLLNKIGLSPISGVKTLNKIVRSGG